MRIAIIQFPGSNCEAESKRAIRQAGLLAEEFLWNRPAHALQKFDGYFIVGGFAYEDRSRAGIIASLDPLMRYLAYETRRGKPLLGICNGAQILVESGLIPGLKNNQLGLALSANKRIKDGKILGTGFYNNWVNIKLSVPPHSTAFTGSLQPGEIIQLPVAHGEGRFIVPKKLLSEMIKKKLTTFRYCNQEGRTIPDFPINPNGAVYNLAAVANPAGNILAMMPHPERSPQGRLIFTSLHEFIRKKKRIRVSPLTYSPQPVPLNHYQPAKNSLELLIDLIITDNEALTIEQTLKNLGIKIKLARQTHWEIILEKEADPAKILPTIIESGEMFNSNKEKLNNAEFKPYTISLLVRYQEDFIGQSKQEILAKNFGLAGIKSIKKGTLWRISGRCDKIKQLTKQIINSHILFNPYSQECYIYQ